MKRYKRTPLANALIFILIVVIIGVGAFFGFKSGFVKTKKSTSNQVNTETVLKTDKPAVNKTNQSDSPNKTTNKNDDTTIKLSLDEWIGWKSIIDANGGLTTQPNSIFDQKGIKVELYVMNDAAQSSNALIKGELNAAGYTINRTAFLSKKFKDAGVDIVMPMITNYSNGGDGIIASSKFTSIESLVDAKIGIPQFSEAQTLVMYLLNESDLTEDQKAQIQGNFVYFETPDEAAKAFFAGHVDAAATWEPYLTQAKSMSDCHILFSTAASRKLIMDGIVFRKDYAEANRDTIEKFIDGVLEASSMYKTSFDAIRDVMPMFSGLSDDEIVETADTADLCTWKDNIDLLDGTAKSVYTDMCDIWTSIGEASEPALVDSIFDSTYMSALSDTYETVLETADNSTQKTVTAVTDENRQKILDAEALLTKTATVDFVISTAVFTDTAEAAAILDEFVETAKILDGAIIQIEGNTDPNPNSDPQDIANQKLSEQRAERVKQYFVMNGIDPNRIIAIGNGSKNPRYPNDSDEHRALNRYVAASFKMIE